jgi:hypothetical protein
VQTFDLTGTIDLHIHVAPDLRDRKMNAVELARAAVERGMRAVLIKSHFFPTYEGAYYASQAVAGIQVFGGLALNESVGGFNTAAVETALQLGVREIWMPTVSAANHRQHYGQGNDGLSLLRDGKLRPEVGEILSLIAGAEAILGTGHISLAETQALVLAARAAGVHRIVVTHPEHPVVAIPTSVQLELRDQGAVFERCYVSIMDHGAPWEQVIGDIRTVGVETTVLTTDFGQAKNISPPDGLAEYAARLEAAGFSSADLDWMLRRTPAALLGLD